MAGLNRYVGALLVVGAFSSPAAAVTFQTTFTYGGAQTWWVTNATKFDCGDGVCPQPRPFNPTVAQRFDHLTYTIAGTVDTDALTISNLSYQNVDVPDLSLSLDVPLTLSRSKVIPPNGFEPGRTVIQSVAATVHFDVSLGVLLPTLPSFLSINPTTLKTQQLPPAILLQGSADLRVGGQSIRSFALSASALSDPWITTGVFTCQPFPNPSCSGSAIPLEIFGSGSGILVLGPAPNKFNISDLGDQLLGPWPSDAGPAPATILDLSSITLGTVGAFAPSYSAPEPGSGLLLASGLFVLATLRRGRHLPDRA